MSREYQGGGEGAHFRVTKEQEQPQQTTGGQGVNEDVGHMVHRRPIPRKGGVRHERQRLQRPVEILPLALKEGIARQGVGDPVVSPRKDADDLVIVECGDAEADRLAEGNCRDKNNPGA